MGPVSESIYDCYYGSQQLPNCHSAVIQNSVPVSLLLNSCLAVILLDSSPLIVILLVNRQETFW